MPTTSIVITAAVITGWGMGLLTPRTVFSRRQNPALNNPVGTRAKTVAAYF